MSIKKPASYEIAYFWLIIWFPKKKAIKPQRNIYLYLINQKYFGILQYRIQKKIWGHRFSAVVVLGGAVSTALPGRGQSSGG